MALAISLVRRSTIRIFCRKISISISIGEKTVVSGTHVGCRTNRKNHHPSFERNQKVKRPPDSSLSSPIGCKRSPSVPYLSLSPRMTSRESVGRHKRFVIFVRAFSYPRNYGQSRTRGIHPSPLAGTRGSFRVCLRRDRRRPANSYVLTPLVFYPSTRGYRCALSRII